jgi:hypothetical protein
MLNELSQTEKDKYCICSLVWNQDFLKDMTVEGRLFVGSGD